MKDPITTGFVAIFAWFAGCVCLPWVLVDTFTYLALDRPFNWLSVNLLVISGLAAATFYTLTCDLMKQDETKSGDK